MATRTLVKHSKLAQAAITTSEFVTALVKACGDLKGPTDGEQIVSIGLAISGGVDSMALAALCSKVLCDFSLNCSHPSIADFKLQAFIVDHSVRRGSEAEAESVSKVLKIRGITTEILKINWFDTSPINLPNFETLARKQRFRLLGQACARSDIRSLLLAHHEDDQAETILARLISGHRGAGLVGMKAHSAIPECHGLHGVYESCADTNTQKDSLPSHSISLPRPRLPTETGGIHVFRPLLEFSKSRLIATCEAYGMPWFEDPTNHDPKITIRNAIRHLHQQHKLPSALSKSRIIFLANTMKTKLEKRRRFVNLCLSMTQISLFDTSTGTIKVQFPPLNLSAAISLGLENTPSLDLASELLRRLISLVTPQENIELPSLLGAVKRVFPEVLNDTQPQPGTISSFTVASLHFQQMCSTIPTPSVSPINSSFVHPNSCWFISRQPCPRGVNLTNGINIPTGSSPSWFLFDGRFWMRVQNSHPSLHLVVQFLGPGNMKSFLAQFNPVKRKTLMKILAERAPGKVRWTIPAIFCHEIGTSSYQPISLPTLYIDAPGAEVFGKWEVRYKKIYTDFMNIM